MVSVGQISSALQTIGLLQTELNNLGALLNQANVIAANGGVINIGTGTPINVTVTPGQQATLIAQYDTLKASLVTTFQTLP